ncbi:molecular chaperone HtpG, partial [bacterium]|nr:molecular chaperone HtpG [bacterium]
MVQPITGEISIHTENIFPIIKKWLYSEHEIFIRELVSNAFDAITKRNAIASRDTKSDISVKGSITLTVNPDAKTITISDNGLGMDADEIQKYINQIAFSGAEEFVKQYQSADSKESIIGHFGLGFYSAFMVASKVEIDSLSYKPGSIPAHWECDGSTSFTITDGQRTEIGTDIVLHISEENESYLEPGKVKELVQKYANFLPVEIKVGDEVVNNQNPLWTKSPSELTDADYVSFYQTLFPYNPDPLFWIHLNVDFPFNFKGILYFPKLVHELDSQKGQVKLFCQQVFVSDSAKEVVPEFLLALQGAIDCPDLPLNVSRSFLQNDPYVQKISKHIIKKVADKLTDIFRADRPKFETYWDDIHPFIKYGMLSNSDFYDKVKEIVIFKSSNGGAVTVDEYLERNKTALPDKIIYSSNKESQGMYIKLCQDQGFEVIFLESLIDSHFIQFLESKNTSVKYIGVEAAVAEHLVDKSETESSDNSALQTLFSTSLSNDSVKVSVQPLKDASIPAILTQPEY